MRLETRHVLSFFSAIAKFQNFCALISLHLHPLFDRVRDDGDYQFAGEFELTTLDALFSKAMPLLAGRVQVRHCSAWQEACAAPFCCELKHLITLPPTAAAASWVQPLRALRSLAASPPATAAACMPFVMLMARGTAMQLACIAAIDNNAGNQD